MSSSPLIYATDEDIAIRAASDFLLLCPADQKLACGADGVLMPANPWTLLSASVDFQANGTQAGQVVSLALPGTALRPGGELFVASATAPGAVTLRRKGQPPGAGMPPCPPAGLTGIGFTVLTLGPQVATATDDLNRRLGLIGPVAVAGCDRAEMRDAVVLTVLARRYLDASREAASPADSFSAKARLIRAELDDLLDRLTVRRDAAAPGAGPGVPSTRFSTRMSR